MKWLFWLLALFAAAYVVAGALFLIGTYGWLGQERDPLAGVFLLPLGLPWVVLADRAGLTGPAPVVLAPLVNLAIFYGLWRRFR